MLGGRNRLRARGFITGPVVKHIRALRSGQSQIGADQLFMTRWGGSRDQNSVTAGRQTRSWDGNGRETLTKREQELLVRWTRPATWGGCSSGFRGRGGAEASCRPFQVATRRLHRCEHLPAGACPSRGSF